MTDLFTHFITTEISGSRVELKELRTRLTKIAKTAPPSADVTIEKQTSDGTLTGHPSRLIVARWTVWV